MPAVPANVQMANYNDIKLLAIGHSLFLHSRRGDKGL